MYHRREKFDLHARARMSSFQGSVHLASLLRQSPIHQLALKIEPRGTLYLRLRHTDPHQTFARRSASLSHPLLSRTGPKGLGEFSGEKDTGLFFGGMMFHPRTVRRWKRFAVRCGFRDSRFERVSLRRCSWRRAHGFGFSGHQRCSSYRSTVR